MSLRILWTNPDGTLAITTIVGATTTADYAAAAQAKIEKGHRTPAELVGVFDTSTFPDMHYWDACRFSAGALVVKLDLARNLRWHRIKKRARARLDSINGAAVDAIMDGDTVRQNRIATLRANLKQLLVAMPAEVANAANLSAIDTVAIASLSTPTP